MTTKMRRILHSFRQHKVYDYLTTDRHQQPNLPIRGPLQPSHTPIPHQRVRSIHFVNRILKASWTLPSSVVHPARQQPPRYPLPVLPQAVREVFLHVLRPHAGDKIADYRNHLLRSHHLAQHPE